MRSTPLRLLACLLLLSAASASPSWPQDDAGSGSDAPDDPGLALAISPGTYNASLGKGAPWNDTVDWFNVSGVPAGHGLAVWVDSTDPATLEPCVSVWSNATTRLDTNGCDPIYPVVGPTITGGPILLRLVGEPWWMNMTFTASIVPLPNIAVSLTDATTDPTGLTRAVNVTLANNGLAPANVQGTLVAGRLGGGALSDSCWFPWPGLAAGETVVFTLQVPGAALPGAVHAVVAVKTFGGYGDLDRSDHLASILLPGPVPGAPVLGVLPTMNGARCEAA